MLLFLGGVALDLVAMGVGGKLGRVGRQLRQRLGRVAVLARVASRTRRRSTHLPTSARRGAPARCAGRDLTRSASEPARAHPSPLPPRIDTGSAACAQGAHPGARGCRSEMLLVSMRPPRADIAAPPLPSIGMGRRRAAAGAAPVAAGPLLVHFFDLAQLNSARRCPTSRSLERALSGSRVSDLLGVHSPFPLHPQPRGGRSGTAAAGDRMARCRRLRARDLARLRLPRLASLFIWSRGGALRWYQLGEGEYAATEMAIREALEEAGDPGGDWPAPLQPLRAGDAPGARVAAPSAECSRGQPGAAVERERRAARARARLRVAAPSAAKRGGRNRIQRRRDAPRAGLDRPKPGLRGDRA